MTEWRKVSYLKGRYQIWIPEPLASWDVYEYWEREQVDSMLSLLSPGDRLFDVGSEMGWQSVVYASIVGGENMVLIEPSEVFWPLLQTMWRMNEVKQPQAFVHALAGRKTEGAMVEREWPSVSYGPISEDRWAYRYLHVNKDLPIMALDDLAAAVGSPKAITIDVEGAELEVLRGAETVLRRDRPLVWVSASSDLAEQNYGNTFDDLLAFMHEREYCEVFVARDHEEHWLFEPCSSSR